MSGRRTNLGLLVLLAVALATGGLAFATGSARGRWVVLAHGVAGLGIVVLVPWKSLVVRHGWRRGGTGRLTSAFLMAFVTVALGSGVLFSTGLNLRYGPLNAMQVHVGAALAAIPFAVWHVWRRPVRPHRVDLARRNLLRAGGVVGVAGVAWLGLEGTARLLRLPGRHRRYTGSYERGSFRPEAMPTTQWLDDRTQHLDSGAWELAVRLPDGEEAVWAWEDLDGFGDEETAILDCTSGWWSEQRWAGARVARLLPAGGGRSIVVTSATGYRRRFPYDDRARLLVATRLGGDPLSAGHGAPARLVAPGRRGFWWVKWVVAVEVSDRPWWWQSPFPLT